MIVTSGRLVSSVDQVLRVRRGAQNDRGSHVRNGPEITLLRLNKESDAVLYRARRLDLHVGV